MAKLALAEEEEEAELVEFEDKMETGPLEEELMEAKPMEVELMEAALMKLALMELVEEVVLKEYEQMETGLMEAFQEELREVVLMQLAEEELVDKEEVLVLMEPLEEKPAVSEPAYKNEDVPEKDQAVLKELAKEDKDEFLTEDEDKVLTEENEQEEVLMKPVVMEGVPT